MYWDTNRDGLVDNTDAPLQIGGNDPGDGSMLGIRRAIGPRFGVGLSLFAPTGRVLRLHIANRMREGAVRELTLYAPYWLVNKTSLSLVFREVRLGTGLLNTAHAMERGSVVGRAASRVGGLSCRSPIRT